MRISIIQLIILMMVGVLLFSDTKKLLNLVKLKYENIRKRGS